MVHFADVIENTVQSIVVEEKIVDLSNSYSSTSPALHITLNHDRILESGLTESQVIQTLALFYSDTKLSISRYDGEKYGASEIHVGVTREDKNSLAQVRSLYFTNTLGQKILLSDIAQVETDFKSHDIYTDERVETIHLYGEMGANSVVYPILKLYSIFGSDEFEKSGFKKISSTPYSLSFSSKTDGRTYTIKW